ncbi:MAG: SDR family oxidoreductase [Hyphomicrobiales bacterium]|nr:SDR family oxidoreductase [Hyphomicrobiales bacterium]
MDQAAAARTVTVITGASAGIGADFARLFADKGHDLALVARDADRLATLADELGRAGRPRPLVIPLDLAVQGAADTLLEKLQAAGARVDNLVNNAGYGLLGNVVDLDRKGQLGMIDLNIRALTDLTLAFLPMLRADKGRILNVASTAAFCPGPGLAIYYATKAYVLSFSEALAHELKGEVSVTTLCPGPTTTEFQSRAGFEKSPMMNNMPKMSAKAVAQIGYDAMMAGKRVATAGFSNQAMAVAMKLSPHALLLPILSRIQGARASTR